MDGNLLDRWTKAVSFDPHHICPIGNIIENKTAFIVGGGLVFTARKWARQNYASPGNTGIAGIGDRAFHRANIDLCVHCDGKAENN